MPHLVRISSHTERKKGGKEGGREKQEKEKINCEGEGVGKEKRKLGMGKEGGEK